MRGRVTVRPRRGHDPVAILIGASLRLVYRIARGWIRFRDRRRFLSWPNPPHEPTKPPRIRIDPLAKRHARRISLLGVSSGVNRGWKIVLTSHPHELPSRWVAKIVEIDCTVASGHEVPGLRS